MHARTRAGAVLSVALFVLVLAGCDPSTTSPVVTAGGWSMKAKYPTTITPGKAASLNAVVTSDSNRTALVQSGAQLIVVEGCDKRRLSSLERPGRPPCREEAARHARTAPRRTVRIKADLHLKQELGRL